MDADEAIGALQRQLDVRRGVLLSSSYEYPGRYTRWDLGCVDPPLALEGRGAWLRVRALNARGRVLLPACRGALRASADVACVEGGSDDVAARVRRPEPGFPEEQRTRQPSLFSPLRALIALFSSPEDSHLGFYGALGYDLVFQLEELRTSLQRPPGQRDLVLYLPDELIVVDRARGLARRLRYDLSHGGLTTRGLPRDGNADSFRPAPKASAGCDHEPGEYEAVVRLAREAFARGDLFEVTPSQTFFADCPGPPSEVFARLQRSNPSPYGFLCNLGAGEYLIGASPEMFVRAEGDRIETCPIAGTTARGGDALGDADQIRALLASEKDEAELTMCTDVDRNDKARICRAGTVRVIGRRQIELYSRLIHTVDHVEGRLRAGMDGLDAIATHCWAVTVTGAPKPAAMQFIEDHEKSSRGFYGGAIGRLGFDGGVNTGLTLRTILLREGRAEVRTGATLLFDSDPAAEARESELKASALLDALRPSARVESTAAGPISSGAPAVRVLLIDHRDSFVHTLADYLRQVGAEVTTLRSGFAEGRIDSLVPELAVLSPGPGRPRDFGVAATLDALIRRHIPVFGVCLGLQAMVEYFGGRLGVLPTPQHGKSSTVRLGASPLFDGLPRQMRVGRYHSLFADPDLPAPLRVTARSEDGCVMAVEHRRLPLAAVQFHPESIMTAAGGHGLRLVSNVVRCLAVDAPGTAAAGEMR